MHIFGAHIYTAICYTAPTSFISLCFLRFSVHVYGALQISKASTKTSADEKCIRASNIPKIIRWLRGTLKWFRQIRLPYFVVAWSSATLRIKKKRALYFPTVTLSYSCTFAATSLMAFKASTKRAFLLSLKKIFAKNGLLQKPMPEARRDNGVMCISGFAWRATYLKYHIAPSLSYDASWVRQRFSLHSSEGGAHISSIQTVFRRYAALVLR